MGDQRCMHGSLSPMNKTLLAIDTSGLACSVALITPLAVYTRFEETQKGHTALLLPMIEALLQEAGIGLNALSAIAVGRGPGSFTGVRIAMSAAQGLAFGLQIPVYPVSTLAALCFGAREWVTDNTTLVVGALDARMHELYAASYMKEKEILTECLIKPAKLLQALSQKTNIIALGTGWDAYYEEIMAQGGEYSIRYIPHSHVHAKDIGLVAMERIKLGIEGVNAVDAHPVYIRDEVAVKPNSSFNTGSRT